MVLDEDAELRHRIRDAFETLLQAFKDTAEAVVLDQKQQLLFRLAVVIEAREADVRRTRDVAHRGRVITLLGEDARRRAEDELQFLIVTRQTTISRIRNQTACL